MYVFVFVITGKSNAVNTITIFTTDIVKPTFKIIISKFSVFLELIFTV